MGDLERSKKAVIEYYEMASTITCLSKRWRDMWVIAISSTTLRRRTDPRPSSSSLRASRVSSLSSVNWL